MADSTEQLRPRCPTRRQVVLAQGDGHETVPVDQGPQLQSARSKCVAFAGNSGEMISFDCLFLPRAEGGKMTKSLVQSRPWSGVRLASPSASSCLRSETLGTSSGTWAPDGQAGFPRHPLLHHRPSLDGKGTGEEPK